MNPNELHGTTILSVRKNSRVVIGGDGFMLTPIFAPGAIDQFVDLMIPEFQRRGVYRTEYKGKTQREILRQED